MSYALNFAGGGIHEVAALRSDGALVAGHFDDPAAAEAAIATMEDYRAVWSSLNQVVSLPPGRTLNPVRLTRGPRAGAQHVGKRCSVLYDFDPPRPKGTMSTNAEHKAVLTQARECRAWLHSLGWPLLPLCDSGSGAHLRPYVDIDASVENTRLIQRVLTALRQRFALIDTTASDLPRLCRYYGTWNRKSDKSIPERPWRMSSVIEEGEQTLITIAQLEDLCELLHVPRIEPSGDGVARPGAQDKFVRRFVAYCERIGVNVDAVRALGDGTVLLQTEFCLLNEDHRGTSCGVGVGLDGVRKNLCKHATCAMPWAKWSRLVEEKYGELMRLDGEIRLEEMNEELLAPIDEVCEEQDVSASGSSDVEMEMPSLNHSDLARDFLASEWGKNFYRVYDVSGKPVASWTGTRWVIANDTDLLRSTVRDYLDRLHDSLPPPPKGRDYRKKLKSAPFCRDVTTEVLIKLTPIRQEAFDRDEYLLGLNDGAVAELRAGIMRPMRREDLISRRIYIRPDANMTTPRWLHFLDEITLGNAELQTFLTRLCALCLTAHPFQGLFFFWGRGRNGKGVLLRLLAHILGRGFTATFRPNELTVSKYDEDKAKRSLNKLEGTRLATVDESLGANLNLPLLKLISGGDSLSAARMRQDDRQFKPSHKLALPTNEKPDLPNDPAFRGRVYFVPFLADFSDRAKQDPNLETTLVAEAPGILAQLIALCPDVIENGLRAPAIVTEATSELLEENDLAKQFEEDMLTDAPGKNVSFDAMEGAVNSWLVGGASGGLTVRGYGINKQAERIMTELKARHTYKRLRPEGKGGRRIYFFLNLNLPEESG